MTKKPLISTYNFLRRHIFGGRGLSRVGFIRNANFAIEEFLRGKPPKVIVKDGLTIHLDPRGSLAERLIPYEPESTALLSKHVKAGDVFVDVGTSIGWFTLFAAKLVRRGGKVYSFEPEPHSFALLTENIKENGFQDVVIAKNAAVSDKDGRVTLYVPGNAWTWSSLEDIRENYRERIEANFRKNEDKTVYEHEVESVRLDTCLPGKVDFIKIDVEGETATDRVFEGVAKTIARNPNMKFLIEQPSQKIIDTLKSKGYSCRFLDGLNSFFEKQ
ncbi:MAG: hypothetical protein A2946_02060 [Candidatus Liptonbacteria bacterium RIFCSPLOWO2_01_FULL_53_13]|uniref:Methyltransferase FkbM domain-containing protein n=1 Tax=Candidatus Liptonbacteria bacterium RIFCSPLOWO2_01_FULL_53_13 TaxID=1798651 RepID=A0A1G2CJT0_9BACT|nr:MAG: hypothetical protein A2946_02060 [Candidatus Liptonbacteria bacterium RIFCSPLOWO2_01_FULL_53_13]